MWELGVLYPATRIYSMRCRILDLIYDEERKLARGHEAVYVIHKWEKRQGRRRNAV